MGGPKGSNWEQALEFYLTPDFEGKIPSYQDVANKFGVSKKEVGLRAKRENWLQRRQNVFFSSMIRQAPRSTPGCTALR